MVAKRALLLCHGNNETCADVRRFIEGAGVMLEVRDIAENQMTEEELNQIFGYVEISHFINTMSSAYKKSGLDKNIPSRDEVIKLMAEDYTLIRCPIVKSSRLLTVGSDKRKIADMLQINADGQAAQEPIVPRNFNRYPKASRVTRTGRK
ncbi:MAG: ArsC/Spx/MgsR family protein [candidate division Zixibacteria bacterium]|nr:ArsC/Spx/MgsR family protein [candidate division Zixibacteria bacterium]